MSKRHPMARGPAFFLSALLVPVFVMAGCEVPEDGPGADPQTQPGQPGQVDRDTVEFTASLSEIHDSGVSGEVRVQRPQANGAVTMILELEDLPYEGEYPAYLHAGDCEAWEEGIFDDQDQQQQQQQMQQQVAELSPVRGFADGTGMSQTTLSTADVPVQQDLAVLIHGQGQQVVACAEIDRDEWDRDRTGTWNN